MVTVFRYPRGERSLLCGGLQHHCRTCLRHPQFMRTNDRLRTLRGLQEFQPKMDNIL